MLDGYLAAVASGPNLIMPDQMPRWVWDAQHGVESPEFTTNKQAQTIVGLIMRHSGSKGFPSHSGSLK